MTRIDIVTIFPGIFEAFLDESLLGAARREGRRGGAVRRAVGGAVGNVIIRILIDPP